MGLPDSRAHVFQTRFYYLPLHPNLDLHYHSQNVRVFKKDGLLEIMRNKDNVGRGHTRLGLAKLVCPVDSTTGPASGHLLSQCSQDARGGWGLPTGVAAEIPGGCRRVTVTYLPAWAPRAGLCTPVWQDCEDLSSSILL